MMCSEARPPVRSERGRDPACELAPAGFLLGPRLLRTLRVLPVILLVLGAGGCADRVRPGQTDRTVASGSWETHAERTNYEETGRYAEAVDFCRRLAAASPWAHFTSFGTSGQGRELPLLILSADRAFTPEAARRSGKVLVLIQNCIHAGECEGKDASLVLAREMLIARQRAHLLNRVNVLIIPIFNVDGHERFGPHNRVNQNGPKETGWRTNASNLNLNRDYVKADSPEMRAWLGLWTSWRPDVFIDTHATNGEDHRYDVLYTFSEGPETSEPVAAWVRDVLSPGVLAALTAEGYATLPYAWLRNRKDPGQGLVVMAPLLPRLSHGYGATCNRPTVLIETHALNPYGRRVQATHAFLRHTLETLNRGADGLRAAIRQADALACARRGADADGRVPLTFERAEQPRRITYRGYEIRLYHSEIAGDEVIEYTKKPRDFKANLYERSRVATAVTAPLAYLVPPQWRDVIERLELHGIRHFRLQTPHSLAIESYRFEDVTFDPEPHEGRMIPKYRVVAAPEQRDFPAGTVVVPLDQPRARLAAHLLEPAAPDSLAAWGFFNAIFEVKEYAEPYALEPLARRMLADDPALRQEFEDKLAADQAFAASPQQRLRFFYRRSPYWDPQHNVYPIARVTDPAVLGSLAPP